MIRDPGKERNIGMKKTILILLAFVLLLSAVGCGKKDPSPEDGMKELEACRTLGEVLALSGVEESRSSSDEETYVYAFKRGGTYYRVTAAMTEEANDALWDIEFFDEEYEKKCNAIISPLTIIKYENLSERIPSKEKINAWGGRTGGDMLDAEWYWSFYNLDTMEFTMEYAPFSYKVVFDGTIEYDGDDEDFDVEAAIRPLTIKSIEFEGLGDATDPEFEKEFK